MVKAGLTGLLMLLSTAVAGKEAFIQLETEHPTVYLGGTVIVTVNATGLDEELSLKALDNLPASRRETSGNYLRVHEGKLVQFATRRIELTPEKAGMFTLGPLTAGEVQSNTLTLQVLEGAPQDWYMSDAQAQLSVSVTPVNAYSQQLMVYEATLRHRYPLASEVAQLPDFKGFRVIPELEARRVWEDEGEGWRFMHWRYLLFPLQSGPLTIAATTISGEIIKSSWERAQFKRVSEAIELDILPPADTGHWWLPAQHVSLSESWSAPPTEWTLGTPVRRVITVSAEGVGARQIADIELSQTRGLTIQPLKQTRSEKLKDSKLSATASFEFELRPTSVAPVFLDTVRVHWWNTETGAAETALMPARRLDVAMPERADLIKAYQKELGWHDRLTLLTGDYRPSPVYVLSTLMLVISLTYLAASYWRRTRPDNGQAQRRARHKILKALDKRNADEAYRLLTVWHRDGQLHPQAQALRHALDQALAQPDVIAERQWQHWRSVCKRIELLQAASRSHHRLPEI